MKFRKISGLVFINRVILKSTAREREKERKREGENT